MVYFCGTTNSKQWYEELLHTLPHNNVQKLNILKFSNTLITNRFLSVTNSNTVRSESMPEISRLNQQISVVMFENFVTILSLWGTLV